MRCQDGLSDGGPPALPIAAAQQLGRTPHSPKDTPYRAVHGELADQPDGHPPDRRQGQRDHHRPHERGVPVAVQQQGGAGQQQHHRPRLEHHPPERQQPAQAAAFPPSISIS
jgi:hypothetical protein